MDMSTDGIPPYVAAGREDINAGYKKPDLDNSTVKAGENNEEPTLIEQVREKGFTQFVKEIEEKKKEEIREKILEAMGLTEEMLQELPAEQRQQIEELIAREIAERMATGSQMNGSMAQVVFQQSTTNMQHTDVGLNMTVAPNMGLGPLLALQETEAAGAQSPPSKESEEDLLDG